VYIMPPKKKIRKVQPTRHRSKSRLPATKTVRVLHLRNPRFHFPRFFCRFPRAPLANIKKGPTVPWRRWWRGPPMTGFWGALFSRFLFPPLPTCPSNRGHQPISARCSRLFTALYTCALMLNTTAPPRVYCYTPRGGKRTKVRTSVESYHIILGKC